MRGFAAQLFPVLSYSPSLEVLAAIEIHLLLPNRDSSLGEGRFNLSFDLCLLSSVMSDDHSELAPLLPIPNRTVKRLSADDSVHAYVKVGHRQTPYQ